MRSLVLIPPALLLGACLPPHPPPAPAPTELAYTPGCGDAVVDPYGSVESLARFAGRYRLGETVITVRHDGQRLLLDRSGFTTRQLAAKNLAAGAFGDGCGLSYSFAPASGPAQMLTIALADGNATNWRREP